MQLTYRGQRYTPHHTIIAASKVPIFGIYRGQSFSFSTPRPQQPKVKALTYRGITYGAMGSGEQVTNNPCLPQLRRTRQHPAFNN